MRVEDIRLLIGRLRDIDVTVCIVGELALNYYNVPRVVHDLELCVPASHLQAATALFDSEKHLLEPAIETEYNIFTEYRRGFPRFRFYREPDFYVSLFPDEHYHLGPLQKSVINYEEHQGIQEYSYEVFDTISPTEVVTLPMPRFVPFFTGLCHNYTRTKEAAAAIAAEQLVDGMNLDEKWCRLHFPVSQSKALKFALNLVTGKSSRISDFSLNKVTCFISTLEEAQRILRIPGYI